MPEFSLSLPGVYCAGNAGDGGVVSTNGQRVLVGPSAGNAHFLNGVEVVCQSYGPHPPKLVAVNVLTGASRDLLLDGVNKIVAGADHWFAVTMHNGVLLDGRPIDYSVRAFAGDYMAWFPWNGTGLLRRGPDGDIVLSTTLGPEDPIQLFPDGGVVWAEGKVHSYGISDFPASPVTVAGGFGWLKAFKVGSVWWLAYQSYALESVVAHPATELIGYRWWAPNAFRLDVTMVAGLPRLIWSRSNADSPADIELRDIDPSFARVDLSSLLPGGPPPPPPPPPEKPVLQAPNEFAVVQRVFAAHPEIDRTNEATRGHAVDYVIAALGGKPWGRKSRNREGTDLNTDGLVYLRTDGKHEIYDIIDGNSGGATWDTDGKVFNPGENGYWAPGVPIDGGNPPPPSSSFAAAAAALEATIANLTRTVQEQGKLIAALAAKTPEHRSITGVRVALRTDNGHWLCAEGGGGGEVNATRPDAGVWETFTLQEQ